MPRSPSLELAGIDWKVDNRRDALPWFATIRRNLAGRRERFQTEAVPISPQGQGSRMGPRTLGALSRFLFRPTSRQSRHLQTMALRWPWSRDFSRPLLGNVLARET